KSLYTISTVAILSSFSGFASSQSMLEDALQGDEHCLTIARNTIKIETIASYEPFDWMNYGFDFTDQESVARAQRLHDALTTYFQKEIDSLFQVKLGMNRTMPEYSRVEDNYKLFVNYKDSIENLFMAAVSATYCGSEHYAQALKDWHDKLM